MKSEPIYLALVWHQHQPYYQELSRREMMMPWVRLHAIKDYYDMPAKLLDYPRIHQTFNLVPSLLKQLKAYESGEATDEYWLLTEKPPAQLADGEKIKLIQRFFDANRRWMIEPYPRYDELRRLREGVPAQDALRLFSEQDLLDLQVWFNLTWIDPIFKEKDSFLKRLIAKGKNFTDEEKKELLNKHLEILGKVIPVHRDMAQSGQIELTTTPFYHPILPLLCDTDVARECMPHDPLPRRFRRPEDAREQIRRGLEYFESVFGYKPQGMWPSEGSVSLEALTLIAENGVKWTATDEDILSLSLGRAIERNSHGDVLNPEVLYRPYQVETSSGALSLVFRDHFLSDLIGFHYCRASAEEAAKDFVSRVLRAGKHKKKDADPLLVSVILDGENCWEYYPRDGHDFLDALYQLLTDTEEIQCVTVGEFLEKHPPRETLKKVFPGSWIYHNFRIWIGHAEDNRSWDILNDARNALQAVSDAGKVPSEDLEKAWEEIYIAEGSDWNWWYGDDHSSGQDELFDQLYRRHLMNAYRFMGLDVPAHLLEPISAEEHKAFVTPPKNFITPRLDGEVTTYFEWQGAGVFNPRELGGAMHQVSHFMEDLRFGFDLDHFYLRMSMRPAPWQLIETGHRFHILLMHPKMLRLSIDQADSFELLESIEGEWKSHGRRNTVCCGKIIELALPWKDIGAKPGEILRFQVQILKDEMVLETSPEERTIPVEVPDEDFELKMWLV